MPIGLSLAPCVFLMDLAAAKNSSGGYSCFPQGSYEIKFPVLLENCHRRAVHGRIFELWSQLGGLEELLLPFQPWSLSLRSKVKQIKIDFLSCAS